MVLQSLLPCYLQSSLAITLLYRWEISLFSCIQTQSLLIVRRGGSKKLWKIMLEGSKLIMFRCLFLFLSYLLHSSFSCYNQAQDGSIDIIYLHECHNDWLKSYQGAKVKISSKEMSVSKINKQKLFNFVTKASPLNFGIKCDQQNLNYKAQITEQHIRLELGQQVKILLVGSEQKLVYQSNLGEEFHAKIITELLARQNKEILLFPFSQILEQIFEKGNHEATDLLVADIFGQENCAFIGLPPKLIAASLGKLNNQHKVWDEAKSILVAFAINIGLQLKQQILTHKIFTAVVSANEFSHPAFFHLIQGLAGLFGSIWFHPHPTLQSFIAKLKK